MSKILWVAALSLALLQGPYCAESLAQQDNQRLSSQLNKLAIQESIAGYLIAINDQDAAAAANYWSQTGQWVDDDGTRVQGPSDIAVALAKSFEEEPSGMSISLKNLTIRLISPTVAIEDGVAVISLPNEGESESSYSVVHVKQNGSWKIDSVRETLTPVGPNRQSQLDSLSWMVGDWVDQLGGDMTIETSCSWTEGNKSLRRSFRVVASGQVVKKGTQIIVWDARLGAIRSWVFDSDGGFGNGIWKQQSPSTWVVDVEFQLADGGVATSTNVYSGITNSKFAFRSVDRTIDGVVIDDIPTIAVVKSNQDNMTQAINPEMRSQK